MQSFFKLNMSWTRNSLKERGKFLKVLFSKTVHRGFSFIDFIKMKIL